MSPDKKETGFTFSNKYVLFSIICLAVTGVFFLVQGPGFFLNGIQHLVIFKLLIIFLSILFLLLFFILTREQSLSSFFQNKLAYFILFTFAYFFMRLPHFTTSMGGEDTLFADIFWNHPQKPNYLFHAHENGVSTYVEICHPSPSHELLSASGKLVQVFTDLKTVNDLELVFIFRLIFALFLYLIFSGLIEIIFRHFSKNTISNPDKNIILISILVAAISPIAIRCSTDLQIDGSAGVFFFGITGLTILWTGLSSKSHIALIGVIFTGCVFAGFGKNEWSLMMLLAIVGFAFIAYLIPFLFSNKVLDQRLKIVLISLTGLVIGNGLSYYFDPYNYICGLDLLRVMAQAFTVFSKEGFDSATKISNHMSISMNNAKADWLGITLQRLEYIYILLIMLCIVLWGFITNIKIIKSSFLLLLMASGALFGGFFASSWSGDPRYFGPSMILIFILYAFTFIAFGTTWLHRRSVYIFYALSLIMTIRTYSLAINLQKKNEEAFFINAKQRDKTKEGDCINLVECTINKPKTLRYVVFCNASDSDKLSACNK